MATFRDTRTGQVIEAHTRARTIFFRQQERYEEIGDHITADLTEDIETDGTVWEVPDGTIAEVLEWVGDDPQRREAALAVEKTGKQRKGVLEALS